MSHENGGRCRPGFTIGELLVALTLSAVVLVGVLSVVSAETKRLSLEREISDSRYTLRAAAAHIAWDLRQAGAGDAALGTITDTSFVVRSPVAIGVVCAKNASGYTLTDVTGTFTSGVADSVQVLYADQSSGGGSNLRVSSWDYFRVQTVGTPPAVGPGSCVHSGQPASVGVLLEVPLIPQDVVDEWGNSTGTTIEVLKDTAGILVGVPFMAYRRTLYGIVACRPTGSTCIRDAAGDSWLGRQAGAAMGTDTWEPLTGPLQTGGLHFSYYAMDGTETADPAAVVAVRITLRSKSAGRTLGHEQMRDSLTVRINLRNCDPSICAP
jgi:type II secretory pathway pseudopilin PulG